jgi:hypothetical protein
MYPEFSSKPSYTDRAAPNWFASKIMDGFSAKAHFYGAKTYSTAYLFVKH